MLVLTGCTAKHYRKTADADAYRAIRQKTPLVPNMDPHFTIEQTNRLSFDGLPVSTYVLEALGPDGERERGARVLRLEDALAIAVEHSRAYQARKEQLYLSGLGLRIAQPRGLVSCFKSLIGHRLQHRLRFASAVALKLLPGRGRPIDRHALRHS